MMAPRPMLFLYCLLAASASARPLSAPEVDQLNRIARGEVSKKELEVVLAQFDEDLSWSSPFEKVRTVYCKGDEHCLHGSSRLPNTGREGYTFLHHIVNNYDNLADWTVFSQAGEPTEGYKGHALGGGHMLTGATFEDYLLYPQRASADDQGAFFLITSKVHLRTLQHSIRSIFYTSDDQHIRPPSGLPPMCPATSTASEASSDEDAWGPYGDVPWLRTLMAEKCGLDTHSVGAAIVNFWDAHLDLPRPPADIAHFAQGARFAASRARIQQRPKAFYEQLLALVSEETDPCFNYVYEWMWYYIIGKPQSTACSITEEEVSRVWTVVEDRRLASGVSGGISGGSSTQATAEKVQVTVTVANMDYTKLAADATLMTAVKDGLKKTMADYLGVPVSNIEVTLGAGSVKADFSITPPSAGKVSATSLSTKLQTASKSSAADSLGALVVGAMKKVPSINTVTTGDLTATVSEPKVVTTTVTQSTSQGVSNVNGAPRRCGTSALSAAALFALAAVTMAAPAQ